MIERAISGDMKNWVLKAIRKSSIFAKLLPKDEGAILSHAKLIEYSAQETIMREGETADFFLLLLNGQAQMMMSRSGMEDLIEIGNVQPFESIGEIGLLLKKPRMATVRCVSKSVLTLQFKAKSFDLMLNKIRGFAAQTARVLAQRLSSVSRRLPLPEMTAEEVGNISERIFQLLPGTFIARQYILPLRYESGTLLLGFVHDPTPAHMEMIRQHHPTLKLKIVRISTELFNNQLRQAGLLETEPAQIAPAQQNKFIDDENSDEEIELELDDIIVDDSEKSQAHIRVGKKTEEFRNIQPLLERMVAEGASDIHLSGGQLPRWRIDGDLYPISGYEAFDKEEVFGMLKWLMPERALEEFKEFNDADFSYQLPGVSRFRVNLYRDEHGINAAMRQIPDQVPNLDDLGLPDGISRITQLSRGLVLVTGPTGSGKSTTLAAIISQLNKRRRSHIVTLEDPIEFVYESELALVHQREIGSHTSSFSRALRASLRQDPDIVLVGELRDLETVRLAMETANTGHLVFGTLHTNTAISTIDRMINLFPVDEQSQARSVLAETLKGVISQMLCKRIGGGRVGAFEMLFVTSAISNLIRQAKTHQIVSAMSTGRAQGQCALNQHLEELVRRRFIDKSEAFYRANDKEDLKGRLG